MKKIFLLITALSIVNLSHAQMEEKKEKNKTYQVGASELIFSFGNVKAENLSVDQEVRFTAFFQFQEQTHIDFNNRFGMYTGFGIRNVGFINTFNDSVKIKQRSYSAGIPLSLKIGNMKNQVWLAIGGEAELMFAYKQKVFYGGEKFKDSEWFSDKVNLFNPSVFAEFHFKKGTYIRFKYYLNDFLKEDKQEIKLFGDPFAYKPTESKMFYVAIGTAIKHKDARRKLNKSKYKDKTT